MIVEGSKGGEGRIWNKKKGVMIPVNDIKLLIYLGDSVGNKE